MVRRFCGSISASGQSPLYKNAYYNYLKVPSIITTILKCYKYCRDALYNSAVQTIKSLKSSNFESLKSSNFKSLKSSNFKSSKSSNFKSSKSSNFKSLKSSNCKLLKSSNFKSSKSSNFKSLKSSNFKKMKTQIKKISQHLDYSKKVSGSFSHGKERSVTALSYSPCPLRHTQKSDLLSHAENENNLKSIHPALK